MATTERAPDPAALRRLLDGDDAEIRNRVRLWLGEEGHAPADDLPRDEQREQVLKWLRELAATGNSAFGFPAEFGGGEDIVGSIASFETMAFGDLSLLVKLGVQFGLFGGAILHLGTEHHHEEYLRKVISTELPGCFAMTETGHGSNVAQIGTTAVYDPETDELVINTPDESARKDYIGNAARDGQAAVVFCQLEVGGEGRGVHAVVVPIRDPKGKPRDGVWIGDCGGKLGLEGVDNGRLMFDHVRVPRSALLNRYADIRDDGSYYSPIENPNKRFFTMLGTLVQGRISVGGASVSVSKVALTIAIRYAINRRQFGPPDGPEARLLDYRTHQRRLLIPLAATYALHFAQDRLRAEMNVMYGAQASEDDRERREVETFAAGLKSIATWHATATVQTCREACGGAGYLRSTRFATLKADSDVFTTFEGDNTVLLQLVAKNLLTDYKDHFGELDPLGVASFVAAQVAHQVAERTAMREVIGRLADAVLPGRDEEGDLLESDEQLRLFRWRQEHILSALARRLRRGIEEKLDPFEVLISTQDHMVDAARAWVDLVVLEAFIAAIDGCEDSSVKSLLGKVRSLYALSTIEKERGWYQEHGKLSSLRSKSVIRGVNAMCHELRPHAELLVDAFGVPETSLGDAKAVL